MTAFKFDPWAALQRAKKMSANRQINPALPTLPTLPTPRPADGRKAGKVGKVGTVRAADTQMTPEELARDLYEERAAIREYDGGQSRAEAERAAGIEAPRP